MTKQWQPQTVAIRGFKEQTAYNEHNQALFLTSSFTYPDSAQAEKLFLGEVPGYTYSRTANPTVETLIQRVALLEGAQAGQATATGMAAIQATFFSFLKAGDHVVVSRDIFGTTVGLVNSLTSFGITVTFVRLGAVEEWAEAIQSNTKLFFLESPSNPLGEVADLEQLAVLAHKHGILVAVDNSLLSPALQRPLDFGVDLVIHSLTKLIDGQGRVFGGAVVGSEELIRPVFNQVKTAGQVLSPFNAWVLLSGLETLFVRVQEEARTALALALWLEQHPRVEQVFYPGLASHPQQNLVQKQQKQGGVVFSFRIKGDKAATWRVIDHLQLFSTTGNLGDVRSIITHPFTTTHAKVSPADKIAAGISENLIRVAVGLEALEDLQTDLAEALAVI